MTFTGRSEGAMTALLDTVCEAVVPEWAGLSKFQQYGFKQEVLPVVTACIDALDAEAHQPTRGDEVEAWIKQWRDRYPHDEGSQLNVLLDDYRLHADVGAPLSEEVIDGGGDQFDGR